MYMLSVSSGATGGVSSSPVESWQRTGVVVQNPKRAMLALGPPSASGRPDQKNWTCCTVTPAGSTSASVIVLPSIARLPASVTVTLYASQAGSISAAVTMHLALSPADKLLGVA